MTAFFSSSIGEDFDGDDEGDDEDEVFDDGEASCLSLSLSEVDFGFGGDGGSSFFDSSRGDEARDGAAEDEEDDGSIGVIEDDEGVRLEELVGLGEASDSDLSTNDLSCEGGYSVLPFFVSSLDG